MKKRLVDFNIENINLTCNLNSNVCDKCPFYINKIKVCKFIPFIKNLKKSKEFLDRKWKMKNLTDLSENERLDIVNVFCKPYGCSDKCPFCYEGQCYKDLVEVLTKENKEKTYMVLERLYEVEE